MPQKTEGLTERQQQVLNFIIEHHVAFKICPTSREIAQRFGFRQTAAMSHIERIIKHGGPISKTTSGRLVYHDPSERIPWDDVKPLIEQLRFAMRPKHEVLTEFFDKYPHLKPNADTSR